MTKRRKGFTLIELLVVITIIAVLAAILFPVFLMARAKARAMGCLSNLKQFGNVFGMYTGDYDGTYPYTALPANPTNDTLGGSIAGNDDTTPLPRNYSDLWFMKLEPYVKYQLVYLDKPQGIMKCKEIGGKRWGVTLVNGPDETGYGYNFLYLGLPFKPFGYSTDNDWNRVQDNPYSTAAKGGFTRGVAMQTNVQSPGETILLVENGSIWAFPPRKADGISVWQTGGGKGGGNQAIGNMFVRPRHGGGLMTNVLWCDGHVTAQETRYLVAAGKKFGDGLIPKNETNRSSRAQYGVATDNKLWDLR